jgi:hypothetical protein
MILTAKQLIFANDVAEACIDSVQYQIKYSTSKGTDVQSIRFEFPHAHPDRFNMSKFSIDFVGIYELLPGAQPEFDRKLPQLLDWNRLEEVLLRIDLTHDKIYITLSSMHSGYFESLITLARKRKVFNRLRSSGWHDVIFTYCEPRKLGGMWRTYLDHIVRFVQEIVVVGGIMELDPLEDFRWWLRRYNHTEYSYVRGLLVRALEFTK